MNKEAAARRGRQLDRLEAEILLGDAKRTERLMNKLKEAGRLDARAAKLMKQSIHSRLDAIESRRTGKLSVKVTRPKESARLFME